MSNLRLAVRLKKKSFVVFYFTFIRFKWVVELELFYKLKADKIISYLWLVSHSHSADCAKSEREQKSSVFSFHEFSILKPIQTFPDYCVGIIWSRKTHWLDLLWELSRHRHPKKNTQSTRIEMREKNFKILTRTALPIQ